jgi:putative membrane protein
MQSIMKQWQVDGFIAIFLILLCFGYFYLSNFRINRKTRYFFISYALILLAVVSPLHFLGENYLMSAHMASHVILILIAGPLFVLAIPDDHENKILNRLSAIMAKAPWLGWLTGVCAMWFWHIPAVFNHLFYSAGATGIYSSLIYTSFLQNVHLISLLVAGMLFAWPVMGPSRSGRLSPLNSVLYLSAACIFCSILGLLITFAPMGIYTPYEHIGDRYGFLHMIRNEGGLSAVVDQQMAGLIMWVPGCLIYLSASIYILMKWFKEKNTQQVFQSNNVNT